MGPNFSLQLILSEIVFLVFDRSPIPPIYLDLIFAILQFEIMEFIKMDISNWRIAKIKCR